MFDNLKCKLGFHKPVQRHYTYHHFMGTATTAVAAYRISRHYVGFELSPDYHALCLERLRQERQQFEEEKMKNDK